jgi:hypothetical protein
VLPKNHKTIAFTKEIIAKGRGGLGPKNLGGNRFYKGHRNIAEIDSHHFKKASISLKMYLKSLAILKKPQFL